ncbi:hypothetical protein ABIB27_003785 [Arthrobacter sp. UYEF21]
MQPDGHGADDEFADDAGVYGVTSGVKGVQHRLDGVGHDQIAHDAGRGGGALVTLGQAYAEAD